jgi:hypothetical protein
MHPSSRGLLALGVLLALLTLRPDAAQAETYRVDLIVFRDLWASDASGGGEAVQPVDTRGVIDLGARERLAAYGISVLPESDFALDESWRRLRNSQQFRPLARLAWTQVNPPQQDATRLRIRVGETRTLSDPQRLIALEVYEVDGSVALLRDRYLHLDVDLSYTPADPAATLSHPLGYPLRERRKLMRDELNHFDSPRLGLLARVSRVDEAALSGSER